MLVATFNATTGWAGRQITWQDERFVLDGHGVITAADVVEYDRQGHLEWPSEEMRSWAGARLSWEQAAAAAAAQAMQSPAVASQPFAEPATSGPAAAQPATPGAVMFGGSAAQAAETSAMGSVAAAEPAATPPAEDALVTPVVVGPAVDEPVIDEPIVTPATGEEAAEPPQAGGEPEAAEPIESAEPSAQEPLAAAAEVTEPATAPAGEVRDVLVPGGDILDVVGVAPYQDALEILAGGKSGAVRDVEKWAHLIPEPDNPWDRNAVAVYVGGRKVGYLPRESSPAYAALLGQLWTGSRGRAVCRAVISGGWKQVQSQVGTVTPVEEEHLGVRLALAAPEHFDVTQSLRQLTAEELADGPPPL